MARRKLSTPAAVDARTEQRTRMADEHEDLMRRLRETGVLKPGDPHYVCNHPRMDALGGTNR